MTKQYTLELTGRTYTLPETACVFCEHCTDIFYDHHGIYMIICNKNSHASDFGNVPAICKEFKEEDNDNAITN